MSSDQSNPKHEINCPRIFDRTTTTTITKSISIKSIKGKMFFSKKDQFFLKLLKPVMKLNKHNNSFRKTVIILELRCE